MLSADNECIWVTSQGATKQEFSFLSQEGANTKLVLGAHTYFKNSLASAIAMYSPSVSVLLFALLENYKELPDWFYVHGQYKKL